MITYQEEALFDVWDEMSAHWPAHYAEVGLNTDKVKLEPDVETYRVLDSVGQIHVVTVRCDGALVGYHVAFVHPHLHYRSSLSAYSDVYYIDPAHRGGVVGFKLFIETEKFLKRRGVKRWYTGTKMKKDMARIFERRRFKEVERQFCKYIGD